MCCSILLAFLRRRQLNGKSSRDIRKAVTIWNPRYRVLGHELRARTSARPLPQSRARPRSRSRSRTHSHIGGRTFRRTMRVTWIGQQVGGVQSTNDTMHQVMVSRGALCE